MQVLCTAPVPTLLYGQAATDAPQPSRVPQESERNGEPGMVVRVVCISRTIGAEGERIGHATAERLGFRYVDEQIITQAARQAQVDPALVAATEHRQPLLQRLLEK